MTTSDCDTTRLHRRRLVELLGGAGMIALAGCLGDDEDDDAAEPGDDEDDTIDDEDDDTGDEDPNGDDDEPPILGADYEPPPSDQWPPRVEPSSDGLAREPPEDATILWDGESVTLDQWEHTDTSPIGGEQGHGDPVAHHEEAEYFEINPGQGDFRPEIDGIGGEIGDCHLHLEWSVPEFVGGSGQGRGNSGIFMMERYEIQVLDNYENETSPGTEAGAYYATEPTLTMPIRPQGEWNEFDIFWRAPLIVNDQVIRLPQVTVFHNGVVVKAHFNVPGPNWAGIHPFVGGGHPHPEDDDGEPAKNWPFYIQDHGADNDVVRFRNIWYRDLPEREYEPSENPEAIQSYDSSHGEEYPEMINGGGPGTTGDPPGDAEMLINELTLEADGGGWESDDAFGDVQVHLEWRVPEGVEATGPYRGASGLLMMGNYQIKILDNYDNPTEAEDWAGAYPGQTGPHHDVVRESGEWQHYDLIWQGPRFDDGEVTHPAQVTVLLNGVAVQTRLISDGPNPEGAVGTYEPHDEEASLQVKEPPVEVDLRNGWIRSLD